MTKKDFELVAGVHNLDFFNAFETADPIGFVPLDSVEVEEVIGNLGKNLRYSHRGLCEENEDFKQIIPYIIITRGDEVFIYRRLGKSGEKRLVNKFSAGIGGHMNPPEAPTDFMGLVKDNMLRELNEELVIETPIKKPMIPKIVGVLNTPIDPVSSVHVGIVYHIILPLEAKVEVRETEVLEGEFKPISEALEIPSGNLEIWTDFCMKRYLRNVKDTEWFELPGGE